MSQVSIRKVKKSFGLVQVIRSVDLEIAHGSFACFLGPSGCGKTTLLRMIAGLEKPTDGEIAFDHEVMASSSVHVPPEKRRVGMVFQNYAVWPHLNVEQNVAFPLRQQKIAPDQARARVELALKAVKLQGLEKRLSHQLSGGQLQRVAIARALVSEPKVLLLDEPFSNLDVALRDELREEVKRLQTELKMTTILVTHDQKEALSLGDKIVVLNEGVIKGEGSPSEIYRHCKDPFVKEFVGQAQRIRWNGEVKLVSPHQWLIKRQGESNALVSTALFMGDYSEVLVSAPQFSDSLVKIRVFGEDQKIQPGDKIHISPA